MLFYLIMVFDLSDKKKEIYFYIQKIKNEKL